MGVRTKRRAPLDMLRTLDASIARRRADADDSGAALILALIFLIVAALTLTALVTFAGTGLLDTAGFTSQRGLQYGAEGAVQIAIQHVRYQADAYPTVADCLGTTSSSPTSGSVQLSEFRVAVTYKVYCHSVPFDPVFKSASATISSKTVTTSNLFTTSNPTFVGYGFTIVGSSTVTSVVAETTLMHTITLQTAVTSGTNERIELIAPYQRLVAFYACRAATCSKTTTFATSKNVVVKALVGFGDLSSTGAYKCNQATTSTPTSTCGESVRVVQWTVASANH